MNWIVEHLRAFLLSLSFFTRLPVDVGVIREERHFHRALVYWPLTGGFLVVMAVGVTLLFRFSGANEMMHLLCPALLFVLLFMGSGGMHEDGLADFADGILGGGNPAKRLEIMNDSRIGTHGAVVLIVYVLLNFQLYWALLYKPWEGGSGGLLVTFFSIWVGARAAALLLVLVLPYLRAEGAKAAPFLMNASIRHVVVGAILGGLLSVVVLISFFSWGCWMPYATMLAATGFIMFLCRRLLGGMTGDCLGACVCVNQITGMFTLYSMMG